MRPDASKHTQQGGFAGAGSPGHEGGLACSELKPLDTQKRRPIRLLQTKSHAEDRDAQARGVALFAPLGPDYLRWVEAHKAIIDRFGRFPHRNAVLGRTSTPEEIEFLKGPDSSF